jgi:flagellar basal-body rod protein FlgG
MKALGTAATGMMAQETNVNVISNNIANASTTGFKSQCASFQDLIYESIHREGAPTSDQGTYRPVGVDVGLGVQTVGTVRLNTQGGLIQTENQLDIAIDGRGYFIVNMPDGSTAYTRDGALRLNGEGQIVTQQGYEVAPGIAVPDDTQRVEVSLNGIVSAYVGDDTIPVEIGQLVLATLSMMPGCIPWGTTC